MSLKLSLVIPTHNRAHYLKKSLPTFFNQSLSKDRYEIIVVDNNSTDNTKPVVHKLLKNFKGKKRYLFEKRAGSHNARNRGIIEAKEEIVVFGDDDIEADKNWLKNILKEFNRNEKAGIVGGKIIPIWSSNPPTWVFEFGSKKLHGAFAYHDYGNKRKVLIKRYLFSSNFAVRRSIAIKAGGFNPDIYPRNLIHLEGDGEIGFADKVRELGYQVIYLPNAVVHHHVPPERLTLEFFIARAKRGAVASVYHATRKGKYPLTIFKQLYTSISKLIKVSILLMLKNPKQVEYKKYLIEKVGFSGKIIQLVRILFKKSLYQHIIKDDYLAELE